MTQLRGSKSFPTGRASLLALSLGVFAALPGWAQTQGSASPGASNSSQPEIIQKKVRYYLANDKEKGHRLQVQIPESPAKRLDMLKRGRAEERLAVLEAYTEGDIDLPLKDVLRIARKRSPRIISEAAVQGVIARAPKKGLPAFLKTQFETGRAGDGMALKWLLRNKMLPDRQALIVRASNAREDDPTSLLAIRALARVPGDDVSFMLHRLEADWSPKVKEAASLARQDRAKLALDRNDFYRAPVYGEKIQDLAWEPGTREAEVSSRGSSGRYDSEGDEPEEEPDSESDGESDEE